MTLPGPSDTELRDIIAIASRTPDHGKLAPWRFVIVTPDERIHLKAGDTVSFPGSEPHGWENPGTTNATVLWIMAT